MSPRWYDSNKYNQHCRANSHLLNSGRKSLMNELHPLHLELVANKSHLKSDTATYAVSSKLYYSQSHRIFPADLLLSIVISAPMARFYQKPVGGIVPGHCGAHGWKQKQISVGKKDESDGPIWWLVSCLQLVAGQRWILMWGQKQPQMLGCRRSWLYMELLRVWRSSTGWALSPHCPWSSLCPWAGYTSCSGYISKH